MNTDQNDTVLQTVCKMIQETAPVKDAKVEAVTVLDSLKMDSLEILSLAMDLEEHYDLHIPDEIIAEFLSVSDIVNYLEQNLSRVDTLEPTDEQVRANVGIEIGAS